MSVMEITLRPALDVDTEFARAVHHQAYRDVVVRQYGTWDEKAQDGYFIDIWSPAVFEIILREPYP